MPIHLPADPPIAEVTPGTELWRVHPRGLGALWFGRSDKYRFDAPHGEYGVCYVGSSLGAGILETLVRGKRVPLIPRAELESRNASAIAATEPLRVVRLEGDGLPSFGISVHQVTGPDYGDCRDLALRVWKAFPDIAGIQYRSRWDQSLCWAMFDRAESKLVQRHVRWLGDSSIVAPALLPYKHVSVI
jgi:hypothetical protein